MGEHRNLQLAVLISGRGSNMLAIAQACRAGRIGAQIALVISDRAGAAGLAAAQELGLSTAVIERTQYPVREDFERALMAAIDASGAGWVMLAGFMRLLSAPCVRHYEGRMLNIHPSLLPRHPGLHTHRRVLEAGEREHGCSVHLVTPELDAGPVIAQARLPVLGGDTEDSVAARVLQLEHRLYPQVIGLIASGRLQFRDGRIVLDGRALETPLAAEELPADALAAEAPARASAGGGVGAGC
ncbi:MAG TPA: phosphoribosylglycinamide formyltransferase [Steroidobacteraceae bacterium]|nr:phosphoribosylglycinamide formyltransferase [Steroidobacteraceae bacterium]